MACSHTTSSERPSLIILSKIALFHHYLFRSIFLIAFITVSIENNCLSLPLAYKLHEGSDFVSVVSPVLRTVLYLISNWKHDPCSFMMDSLGLCVSEWSGQHLEYLINIWKMNPKSTFRGLSAFQPFISKHLQNNYIYISLSSFYCHLQSAIKPIQWIFHFSYSTLQF